MTVSNSEPAPGGQRGHSPCSKPEDRHVLCLPPGLPATWQRFRECVGSIQKW